MFFCFDFIFWGCCVIKEDLTEIRFLFWGFLFDFLDFSYVCFIFKMAGWLWI